LTGKERGKGERRVLGGRKGLALEVWGREGENAPADRKREVFRQRAFPMYEVRKEGMGEKLKRQYKTREDGFRRLQLSREWLGGGTPAKGQRKGWSWGINSTYGGRFLV